MTTATVHTEFGPLRRAILRRITPLVQAAGLTEHEVSCSVTGTCADLRVVLHGPPVTESVRSALGVRVLDAVHADGRTFGRVGVTFDPVD